MEYCEPKSTTTTASVWCRCFASAEGAAALVGAASTEADARRGLSCSTMPYPVSGVRRVFECSPRMFERQTSDNRHKHIDGKQQYRQAVQELRRGGIVALPTDTVYD